MQTDGAIGNGQPHPKAAGVAVTSVVHSIERTKNIFQLTLGQTRPGVAPIENDGVYAGSFFAVHAQLHPRLRTRVAYSIAHHVLDSPIDELRAALDPAVALLHYADFAQPPLRF